MPPTSVLLARLETGKLPHLWSIKRAPWRASEVQVSYGRTRGYNANQDFLLRSIEAFPMRWRKYLELEGTMWKNRVKANVLPAVEK